MIFQTMCPLLLSIYQHTTHSVYILYHKYTELLLVIMTKANNGLLGALVRLPQ